MRAGSGFDLAWCKAVVDLQILGARNGPNKGTRDERFHLEGDSYVFSMRIPLLNDQSAMKYLQSDGVTLARFYAPQR